ncbi:GAF domain-containing protein [Halovenus sp. HT40]|uniref:GAF domain-containing protein n=1 Tax=Halovenus sp. HT40 TaxID=3126691 RepID=UPI00300F3CC4
MTTEQPRTEALYEISLAIRQRERLADTAREALLAYVEQLECSVAAVFAQSTREGDSFTLTAAVPTDASEQSVSEHAREHLQDRQRRPAGERDSFPLSGQAEDGTDYWLLELPEFGVLLLAGGLDRQTALALEAVNEQLAAACRNARESDRLRAERDRFEAIFDAIQEPIVTAVYDQGEPIVRRVNDTFLEVFGFEEAEVVGASVNDLIVPDSDIQRTEAGGIDAQLAHGVPVVREITREAADGTRDFLLRAVPVNTDASNEYVGIFVDITDNKARQRRFEWLYDESRAILGSTDTETICDHALDAGRELLDFSRAAVYRYDRATEALVPTVTVDSGTDTSGNWEQYTEEGSVAWEVFRSGPRWFEDLANCELSVPCGEKHGSALFLPLGEHGVMMMATEQPGAFDETDFQVAKLLSVVVEVALDRALRERGLAEIQSITRRVLDADDHEEAARAVLDQLPAALDMPMSAIWRYDAASDALDPIATTEAALDLVEEIPTFSGDDSIAWRAFDQGETKLVGDVSAHENVYNEGTPFKSEILMPLGDFGVLATASTRQGSFTESERRLLETLAANVETAMRLVSHRHERDLLDQVIARVLRHNLRNDLNVIQGHAVALTDYPEVTEHAEAIIEHCEDLQNTAQNARKMREIVDSSGETTTLSLPAVVDHALGRITEKFPDTEITVEVDSVPHVIAHPALPTAIEQLLENSIEHAEIPASAVSVALTISKTEGAAVVEIADNGPGVPQEELEILDQHGESALEHGSGAGLWMVDRVVEYSNATIEFNTDDGTTVQLRFDPA